MGNLCEYKSLFVSQLGNLVDVIFVLALVLVIFL